MWYVRVPPWALSRAQAPAPGEQGNGAGAASGTQPQAPGCVKGGGRGRLDFPKNAKSNF